MVKEKSGVIVDIDCKGKKLVVYNEDGTVLGVLTLFNSSWKVCGA